MDNSTTANGLVTPVPLDISCHSSACELGQHYYGPKRRDKSKYQVGECCDCGVSLVDWTRVHVRAIADVEYTFGMLKTECWRHEWWHRPFDETAVNHARRKGRLALASDVQKRLAGRALAPDNGYDGQQTPRRGNVIFYAQHATATCCRKCLQYWHGIPGERSLSDSERNYLSELIMKYIDLRFQSLTENGEHVPRRKSKKGVQ